MGKAQKGKDMSVDTVEMYPAVNGQTKETKESPAMTWDYTQGLHLLPSELHADYTDVVSQAKFGSKSLRLHLYRAWVLSESQKEHVASVVASLTGERAPIDLEKSTRNKNRTFLTSLSNDVLERYCTKYNVSYQSFMNQNDRQGMIEAIVDEMLV